MPEAVVIQKPRTLGPTTAMFQHLTREVVEKQMADVRKKIEAHCWRKALACRAGRCQCICERCIGSKVPA